MEEESDSFTPYQSYKNVLQNQQKDTEPQRGEANDPGDDADDRNIHGNYRDDPFRDRGLIPVILQAAYLTSWPNLYLRAMQFMRWLAIFTGGLLIALCFLPWVTITIQGAPLSVEGFDSEINQFGKPGVFFLIVTVPCVIFLLINKIWSIRIAFFASALNIAWSIRNYFLLTACSGGNCPEVHPGLYIIILVTMLFTVLILLAGNFKENREMKKTVN